MQYFEVVVDAQTGEQTIRKYTAEEIAEAEKAAYEYNVGSTIAERNQLLSACDWTQLPDSPVDQTAWAAYRQALRDVTDQDGFPANVIWPVPPI